jgi:SOS-response transcriptional repressor LexA
MTAHAFSQRISGEPMTAPYFICPHCGEAAAVTLMPLTQRTKDLVDAIAAHIEKHGIGASFEDLMAVLNLKSKSRVAALVQTAIERGWIVTLPRRPRAIDLSPAAWAERKQSAQRMAA